MLLCWIVLFEWKQIETESSWNRIDSNRDGDTEIASSIELVGFNSTLITRWRHVIPLIVQPPTKETNNFPKYIYIKHYKLQASSQEKSSKKFHLCFEHRCQFSLSS